MTRVVLYKNNPRQHSKRQIELLAKAFQLYGMLVPILIDEAGVIIAGHARYLAAKLLGMETIPSIVLSHLGEAAKRRLRIADNKHSDNSRFSSELLKTEIMVILAEEPEIDAEALAFEVAEVDLIIHADSDSDDDQLPEAPVEARTQKGDVWDLNGHIIACGDARDQDFLARILAGRLVDAAFHDFPYNVSITNHATRSGQHAEFAMASGEMTDGEFIAFLRESMLAAVGVTRDGGVHFLCMDHAHLDQLLVAANPIYGARLQICVWNKTNAGMGSLYRSKHEFIAVYRVGSAQHINNVQLGKYGRSRTSVWDYASVNMVGTQRAAELKLHPTTKPVAMVADAIKDVTKPGDTVLDSFLGSGTTLIAAERTGRLCVGVEFEPHYVDVAIDRWITLTGGVPVLKHRDQVWSAPTAVNGAGWGARNG